MPITVITITGQQGRGRRRPSSYTPKDNLLSHVLTIKTAIKDAAAVRAACQRLGLPAPVQGTTKLCSGEATGLAVQLHDWVYPLVADLATGQIKYDNFQGRWGDQHHLDHFLQMYSVEKAKIEARRRGHQCTEQALPDGAIKLTIQVSGGAQ